MAFGEFKRKYRYKSDSSSRGSYWLAIIISAIAFIVIWYFM
jgi:uncharacterized membrane-anchored protein